MAALLSEILLRQVPEHLIASVSSGECRVYGSIIRSLATGRIVAHLQETSALTNLAGDLLAAPALLPLQTGGLAIDAIGHSISYIQNEQIKAGIAVLQSMQIAGLALGAAAIGVSVAGFTVLSRKLGRIEGRLDALEPRLGEMRRTLDEIRADQIAEDFVRLRTACQQLEEAWLLPDPASQWRSVANEAHFLANQFQRRAGEVLDSGPAAVELAEPFAEAISLTINIRVTARLAAGDDVAALAAAEERATALLDLGEKVRLGEAALASMDDKVGPATLEWERLLDETTKRLRSVTNGFRMRGQASAAMCLTLAEFERQKITGREWLEAARDEQEAPLLCLLQADD